jgi:hypothetical protein
MKQLSRSLFSTVLLALAATFFVAIGCQQPDASRELKPIGDAYVEAWNTGNLDALDAIIDPQFARHISPAVELYGNQHRPRWNPSYRQAGYSYGN